MRYGTNGNSSILLRYRWLEGSTGPKDFIWASEVYDSTDREQVRSAEKSTTEAAKSHNCRTLLVGLNNGGLLSEDELDQI